MMQKKSKTEKPKFGVEVEELVDENGVVSGESQVHVP
jgi:hypothetical protein